MDIFPLSRNTMVTLPPTGEGRRWTSSLLSLLGKMAIRKWKADLFSPVGHSVLHHSSNADYFVLSHDSTEGLEQKRPWNIPLQQSDTKIQGQGCQNVRYRCPSICVVMASTLHLFYQNALQSATRGFC